MSELTDAVICEPLRTPVGRYGGVFRNVPAEQLAATVIRGLLKRAGLDRLLPGAGRLAAAMKPCSLRFRAQVLAKDT
jgi:acetyl-CoA acetyltransferase